MTNKEKAQVRDELRYAALRLLAEDATEEVTDVEQRRICRVLEALFIERLTHTKRLDPILKLLPSKMTATPQVLALAQAIDNTFIEYRRMLIQALADELPRQARDTFGSALTLDERQFIQAHTAALAAEEKAQELPEARKPHQSKKSGAR